MSDKNAGMNDRPILLVEDNRDDLELTIMSLRKEETSQTPKKVLKRIRADERTRTMPVIVLTSSIVPGRSS